MFSLIALPLNISRKSVLFVCCVVMGIMFVLDLAFVISAKRSGHLGVSTIITACIVAAICVGVVIFCVYRYNAPPFDFDAVVPSTGTETAMHCGCSDHL